MEETQAIEELFENAAKFIRSKADTLSSDKLLNLYGLFKQATEGPNTTTKPNFWNVAGKQKWEAWFSHGEKSKKSAMEDYISLVTDIDPTWREQPASATSWVHHSVLSNTDTPLEESEKDIFHWVKENNIEAVRKAAKSDLDRIDVNGMRAFHWAADRGHLEIIGVLLERGVDVNIQDRDGQTALHFASSCGHGQVVEALLKAGAVADIADSDGCTPKDFAACEEIERIFEGLE